LKAVLIALVVYGVPLPATTPDKEADVAVFSNSIVAEYESIAACLNGAKVVAKSMGDKLLHISFSCTPKDIAKLEVVPPAAKPNAAPQPIPRGNTRPDMGIVLAFFDTKLGKYLLMAAVAIAAALAFGAHERGIGYREAMDKVDLQRQAEEKAYLALMVKRQNAFNAIEKKYAELTASREGELQAKDKQRVAELAALMKRGSEHVTPASTRSCPDVPRSYLLFRADAAAFANRATAAIPTAAGAEPVETASGVSLPALTDTDAGQAAPTAPAPSETKAG
jgi:hypothetical protein